MKSEAYLTAQDFFRQFPLREYKKGEIIARPGKPPPGILYIERGQVTQYDISDDGREIILNIFKEPAFFPMSWAINRTPNVYFYEALTAVKAHCAPPDETVAFLQKNPEVTFDLLSRVYRGTDGLQRRMAHSLGGRASTLVLFEIIVGCKRFGTKEKEHYTLSITDQEMASRTGLSRETVNRELQELKQAGLIGLGYGKIEVPNLDKLEKHLGSRL